MSLSLSLSFSFSSACEFYHLYLVQFSLCSLFLSLYYSLAWFSDYTKGTDFSTEILSSIYLQFTMYEIQNVMLSAQFSVFGVQRSAFSLKPKVCNIWNMDTIFSFLSLSLFWQSLSIFYPHPRSIFTVYSRTSFHIPYSIPSFIHDTWSFHPSYFIYMEFPRFKLVSCWMLDTFYILRTCGLVRCSLSLQKFDIIYYISFHVPEI